MAITSKLSLIFVVLLAVNLSTGAPTTKKMCYNLACADFAAICYYSAEATDAGKQILETTMCLDSAENVLQKETKKRSNILGTQFSTEHVLPFKGKNWIGSGDVPETAAEVMLTHDDDTDEGGEETQ